MYKIEKLRAITFMFQNNSIKVFYKPTTARHLTFWNFLNFGTELQKPTDIS